MHVRLLDTKDWTLLGHLGGSCEVLGKPKAGAGSTHVFATRRGGRRRIDKDILSNSYNSLPKDRVRQARGSERPCQAESACEVLFSHGTTKLE